MKNSLFTAFAVGLVITANVWAQVPSYVPTNGLVGWWPFNGNAIDESGNGNNGTVNGAALTSDRFLNSNDAYFFDGVSNFIEVPSSTSLMVNNAYTISAWVYVNSYNSGGFPYQPAIVSKIDNGDWYGGYEIRILNNATGTESNFGTSGRINGNFINISQNNHSVNQWYHLVVNYDGTHVEFFINNQTVGSISVNGSLETSSIPLRFGRRGGAGSNNCWYNGKIDDIGIWNRALSDCEIQDLYNSQINSVAGSIAVSPQLAPTGSNVSLTTATNSTNLQWQSNPSNYGWQNVPSNSTYSGGTTNTLTVNNVQLANHNQPFRVIASNGNCTDTSNIATIQIADTCITNVTVYDTLLTTVTDTLIINTTLSLPAPNNENTILIYPNPASDHITIDNGNFTAMSGYSIKIENNAGQQVFQSAINQAQFYVDLSTWTGNGLYFVHLIDPQNNTVTVRKIVLQ
jgi:hypothetical protein